MPFDATPIANPVADQLRIARSRIERAWCQGRGRGSGNAVCAAIAVLGAGVGDGCIGYLRRALRARGYNGSVVTWNDMPERTKEDVVALCEEAILLAQADAPNL